MLGIFPHPWITEPAADAFLPRRRLHGNLQPRNLLRFLAPQGLEFHPEFRHLGQGFELRRLGF